jgi:hypothetical protein
MTALLFRSPAGWDLLLTFTEVYRFSSSRAAKDHAAIMGWRVRRSPKLDY